MHHFLYPVADTYITNRTNCVDKNFGIDELLQIGTDGIYTKVLKTTKDYSYSNVNWNTYCVTDFNGILTGSFVGTSIGAYGTINASASFTTSYFSGSIDAATIVEYSGSISGSAIGRITGSLVTYDFDFTGSLTGSSGLITGLVSGVDTRNKNWWDVIEEKQVDRTLIQFDLTDISASIIAGEIIDPHFKLNLKVCNEFDLPITYKIYAFPVSQSWDMGNGYFSDKGSDSGASWMYRDYSSGSLWYAPYTSSITSRSVVDFINDYTKATASFGCGGGTWYNSKSLQTFSYEASDISMDVTDTVLAWISGSIPNNGFILMSSDEVESSGSGFVLTFYSRDTNSINSPYLDVMWEDWVYSSGSQGTGSVVITSSFSGMQVTVQSSSVFSIDGGVYGTFSAGAYLVQRPHYVTASNSSIVSSLINFTGSMSGSLTTMTASVSGTIGGDAILTSSYFSGSVSGGVIYESNNAEVSGSGVVAIVSGSLTSASLSGFSGSMTASAAVISGIIFGYYFDTVNNFVGGFLNGTGNSGNLNGLSINGSIGGLMTISQSSFTGSCGRTWNSYIMTASFVNGVFSGSTITGEYSGSKFEDAYLTGAWTEAILLGTSITIPLPSGIDPYAYATVVGTYANGRALGIYQTTRSIDSSSVAWDSASFSGQFIDGSLLGGYLTLQLSGSVYTSSYSYTSSVSITSSMLEPLNSEKPFTVIVKNLKPTYKGGDVTRINVFGRKQFPLKTFGKTTQQTEYLVPEYLPTSSFYAIKDNESEEIIVDFDNYTRLSCEYPAGNFFYLDTTGLAQERQYRVLIRVENADSKYTFDSGNVFKITR